MVIQPFLEIMSLIGQNSLHRPKQILLYIVVSIHCSLISSSDGFDGEEAYNPVSWISIQTDDEFLNPKMVLEGVISFEGLGETPSVFLWKDEFSYKNKVLFRKIDLDPVTALKLIEAKFGKGAENWRVLEGLFVEVVGDFERKQRGFEFTGLGSLRKVRAIRVKNNDRVLVAMEK